MILLEILVIIIIAISLSMDAFSLSLIYGTQNINKKGKILLPAIVGVYHFFMPLFGLMIGLYVEKKIIINTNILVGIILSLIALEMMISSFKKKEEKLLLSLFGYLIFGLSVSIDSFSTGIGLSSISERYVLCSSIFSLSSFFFTFLGLNLGNILNQKYGKISTFIGGSVLFIIGIIYIFK